MAEHIKYKTSGVDPEILKRGSYKTKNDPEI